MNRKLILMTVLMICFFISTGLSHAETGNITVSAAISLKNAFEEIGRLYEAKQAIKVSFNFGASGDLMRQIEGGAPVDVFASAAQKDMDLLDQKGLIATGTRANFAGNALVLIVPVTTKTSMKSFEGLKADGIKKIAVGNPKTAPAGRYTEEIFQYYKLSDMLRDKLILTENVRQALDYVARGEVDAGVVYATDGATRPKVVKIVATAPEQSHKPVIYPIGVVKGTKNETAARAFIAMVRSAEGKSILEKYGFKEVK